MALQQPNGTVIPSPAVYCAGGTPGGLGAMFACQCLTPGICNIGAPCPGGSTSCDPGQNGVCETTLWHNVNDDPCIPSNRSGLDPVAEAKVTPATFRPVCPLTFTVVSRGQAIFHNAFGWYNVTGSKPSLDDLHVMLDCADGPGTQVVLDLRTEPDYLGGEVGFFLVTPESHTQPMSCARGDCCASLDRIRAGEGYVYYSESDYNPDHAGASSFIHLIVYDSHIVPRKFYFAWEDIYGGNNNEFMDLVTSVEGIDCSGAGVKCDTGKPGICSFGVTSCAGGSLSCAQVHTPAAEACDGVDNDCDGLIDNGATCPAPAICHEGRCVPPCTIGGEFDCPGGLVCDTTTGFCHEPTCAEVSCPPNTVCRGGSCVGGCEGIVCPHGQTCRLGFCVSPCDGIVCPANEVCAEGLCLPDCRQCGGVLCEAPLRCDIATGACVDPSCPAGCPDGTFCKAGSCADACEGAVCPAGQVCAVGRCVYPGSLGDGGLVPGGTGDGGLADGAAGSGLGNHLTPGSSASGCSAAAPRSASAPVLIVALAALLARRRLAAPSRRRA